MLVCHQREDQGQFAFTKPRQPQTELLQFLHAPKDPRQWINRSWSGPSGSEIGTGHSRTFHRSLAICGHAAAPYTERIRNRPI